MIIEAMKLAFDALETYGPDYMHGLPKKHYTKALRQATEQAEKQKSDEALLRQAFDAIVNVLSGADYDDPYASLKEAAKALSDRLGGGLK